MFSHRALGALTAIGSLLVLAGCTASPPAGATRPSPSPSGAAATAPSPTPPTTSAAGTPVYDHIFLIVMENHSFSQVIGNPAAPYINGLAGSGAVGGAYKAVGYPSLPNYLALTGGSTFGINSDCTSCWVAAPNLADRVDSSGRTWKAYMEGMPSACYIGSAGSYAQKHNPFVYYDSIRLNAGRCAQVVPYTSLAADLASAATTPSLAWITPDGCHDMHDCSVAAGDAWLAAEVPVLLGSPAFTGQHSLLLIVWDEDDHSSGNQVPLIAVGSRVRAGYFSSTSANHYSLLRTIEDSWGLAPLALENSSAPMSDLFVR